MAGMKLDIYLKKIETAASFAKRIGAYESDLSKWRHGKAPVPIAMCRIIEDLTYGRVDRKTTCPKRWRIFWPELENK